MFPLPIVSVNMYAMASAYGRVGPKLITVESAYAGGDFESIAMMSAYG